jgi:hypothetical protein
MKTQTLPFQIHFFDRQILHWAAFLYLFEEAALASVQQAIFDSSNINKTPILVDIGAPTSHVVTLIELF